VLEESDPIDDAAFSSTKVIVLSSGGKLLRAWSATVRARARAACARGAAPLQRSSVLSLLLLRSRRASLRPLTRIVRHCLQDGALLWEEATYSSALGTAATDGAVKPVLLLGKVGERETVATLSRGRVQVRQAASPRIHAPDFGSDCRLALARPQVRSAADGSLIWDTDASSHASGALLSTCVRCLRGSLPPAADALALPSRRASGWRHHPTEARCMQLA
jgi:hypothetical protein